MADEKFAKAAERLNEKYGIRLLECSADGSWYVYDLNIELVISHMPEEERKIWRKKIKETLRGMSRAHRTPIKIRHLNLI